MNNIANKVLKKCLSRDKWSKSKKKYDWYNRTQNPMCVVCKKKRGSELYGDHVCSLECERKYSENEEAYFR